MQLINNLDKLEDNISNPQLIKVGFLILWWINSTQKSKFLLLLLMTINIFYISTISSKAKKIFSEAKLAIINKQLLSYINTIKAFKYLKS